MSITKTFQSRCEIMLISSTTILLQDSFTSVCLYEWYTALFDLSHRDNTLVEKFKKCDLESL